MKITKGTIIRTIMLGIVLINYALKAAGIELINITESQITEVIEALVSIGVIVTGFWYNNSYSENAKKADEFMKQLNEEEQIAGE
jgi:SPP1 family holin